MLTNRNTIALTFCLLSSLTVGAQNQQPVVRQNVVIAEPVLLSAGTPDARSQGYVSLDVSRHGKSAPLSISS